MAKTLFRLLLKLVLLPVSLVLLLAKGAICLALKLVELPLGLFIWLIGIIIVFCIFNQRWRDVGVGALIMGVVYGLLFLVTLLEAMIDGLQEKIRSI